MALELINSTIEAFTEKPNKARKPDIPSLTIEPDEDEKKADVVYKYYDGEIVNKEFTDKQGQRSHVEIPKWMQKGAEIPDHVKDLKCQKISFPKTYYNIWASLSSYHLPTMMRPKATSKSKSNAEQVKFSNVVMDKGKVVDSDSLDEKNECRARKWVVLIHNVLTKEECNDLIKFSEEQGYEDALVNIGWGRQQKLPDFRNCKRMMIDNYEMVNCLWSRTQQFIPTYFDRRKKISFNERLRFLRYHKGEFFGPHLDGTYRRENGEISKLTFLVYLNDGFKGGSTRFLQPFNAETNYHAPKIKAGMVVMFQHDVYHEGAMLEEGVKYIIRTDVMYTKKKYKASKISAAEDNVAIKYAKYDGWDIDTQIQEDEKNDK